MSWASFEKSIAVPPMRREPDDGASAKPMMLRSVLFPHPDGPTKAANSPDLRWNETSRTACTVPDGLWKPLEMELRATDDSLMTLRRYD